MKEYTDTHNSNKVLQSVKSFNCGNASEQLKPSQQLHECKIVITWLGILTVSLLRLFEKNKPELHWVFYDRYKVKPGKYGGIV